jgi:hypothetical protein
MIFGRVMTLGLCNLAKYLVVFTLFDLIFGMRVYNHKLQISFEIRSGSMIFWPTYSRWALKFGQIFSCHHFFFTMI